jgi:hypothetical protein
MRTETEWAPSLEHPGYRVKIIKNDNYTVEIYRPELSEAERKKREKHVQAVAERVLSNYYFRKERENEQQNNN